MRGLVAIALLAVVALPAQSAELPDWAYPVNPPPKPADATTPIKLNGSAKTYTQAQIDDGFNPPDWYPSEHKPMPEIVAHGRKDANVRACTLCHLANGAGHPESAGIAGLPGAYFIRQMNDFKTGARHGGRAEPMLAIAKAMTDDEIKAAASYFGSMRAAQWYKVVETDTVPKSYLGNGALRLPMEEGGSEPLGDRIIELPQNPRSAESRDPHTGFVAYVPMGSLKKGDNIVNTGGGKTMSCTLCHGFDLKGIGDTPPIIGRSPTYIFRQINDVKRGARNGSTSVRMKTIVEKLDEGDMIGIAAYLASKKP